jgi:predicted nucleotidyltransferase
MAQTAATVSTDQIVKILLHELGSVEQIILFGSRARGDADEYSDLDLIVVQRSEKPFIERMASVPLLPVHADVFVYTPGEFARMKESENPFLMHALDGAKVLYPKQKS